MDKIWYINPLKSEVVAGMKKSEWPRRTDKSRTLKKDSVSCNQSDYFMDVAERLCISGKHMYSI